VTSVYKLLEISNSELYTSSVKVSQTDRHRQTDRQTAEITRRFQSRVVSVVKKQSDKLITNIGRQIIITGCKAAKTPSFWTEFN